MAFGAHSTAEEVTDGLDLRGSSWLVTGCNSGLGQETARVLALRGAHVIGLARTLEKADDAMAPLGGTGVACELSDLASVAQAVEQVTALGRPLRGIIANAGIMALPELKQKSGYELQFYTNHVGHAALVTGLVDQLEDGGRVVMLSSGAHRYSKESGLEIDNLSGDDNYDPWRMYGRSKLANILFARGLSTRFAAEGRGRTANSLHPGVIATNLARHVPNAEAMFESLKAQMKTVEQGAATQCYVATRPELSTVSGEYFSDCAQAKAIDAGYDDALAETLWRRTEAIIAAG
ncbi:MAG: WW domain-containing oxidoreductase [Myxococcota bacterium]|jgi:WW domain-containing oxidoreductase